MLLEISLIIIEVVINNYNNNREIRINKINILFSFSRRLENRR